MINQGDNKKYRILMISAEFIPEIFGGAINQCYKVSKELVERGNKVTVLTSRSSKELPEYENLEGIEVIRLWTGHAPQKMGKYIWSSLLWLIKCQKWFAKTHQEYDIIHVHQAKFQAYIGSKFGRKYGKPVIAKVGNSERAFDLDSLKRKTLIGNHLYKVTRAGVTRFIAISSQIYKDFVRHEFDQNQVLRIPNGVNQNYTLSEVKTKKEVLRNTLFPTIKGKILLSAGRLSHEKNLSLLFESYAKVKSLVNEEVHIVLLGEGKEKDKLIALSKTLKIENNVHFLGYQKAVLDYMLASDFFVLPSLVEGMSNSLLEAMSIGLVPISNAISGSEDLIENNVNGFLVNEPWDTNFADAMENALNLSEEAHRKMSENSYLTIKNQCAMSKIAERYEQLYEELI